MGILPSVESYLDIMSNLFPRMQLEDMYYNL